MQQLTLTIQKELGDTDVITCVKQLIRTKAAADDVEALKLMLDTRPSAINLANAKGYTALHLLAMSTNFPGRAAAIRLLLEHGANAYLTTPEGQQCVDLAQEDTAREEFVAALLAYRLEHEKSLKSVAPLCASRLMKRSGDDTGTGVFSNVAKSCMYFSYKGAIFMWDVDHDVEHVIFQPRDHHPQWCKVDSQMAAFQKRRSFVSHGGIDTSFDINAGEALTKQLRSIEQQVALVTNFTLVTGVDAQKDPLPAEGVKEWVLCNTGALVCVRMTKDGPALRKGRTQSMMIRRKSEVCGGTAAYPDGMVPDVQTYMKGAIRYTRRGDAGQVCCAADGANGTIAYVVATKSTPPAAAASAVTTIGFRGGLDVSSAAAAGGKRSPIQFVAADSKLTPGQDALSIVTPPTVTPRENGITYRDAFGFSTTSAPHQSRLSSMKSVSFGENEADDLNSPSSDGRSGYEHDSEMHQNSINVTHAPDASLGTTNAASNTSVYVQPSEGIVFRVVSFVGMDPKHGGLDDSLLSLGTNTWAPFDGCEVTEFKIPREECGDPLVVLQCRERYFILVTQKKIIVADADPKRRTRGAGREGYAAQFFEWSAQQMPTFGLFTGAAAMAPPRFRRIKPNHSSYFFSVVSEAALSVYEVHDDRTIDPVLRIFPDRISPHRFTPYFHPTEDHLLILYQSLLRQEVCSFNLITRSMQSVCKLPKPSSLRFYTQLTPAEEKERRKKQRQGIATTPEPEVPHLNFSISSNGEHFLRYNVTMHVMSVYSWSEIRARGSTMPYINVAFTREPLPPPPDPRLVVKPKSTIRGSQCVWIVAECRDLQLYQQTRGMTVASTHVPEGEEDTDEQRRDACRYVDSFAKCVQEVFQRVAAGLGARSVPYEPKPFAFDPPPGETYDDEEMAEMELAYHRSMPRHHGVWCASITAPLEAVRGCIKMTRELLRAPWDAKLILDDPRYRPIALEYQPKNSVERRFASAAEKDPEAATWLQRGPKLRYFVCTGETTTHPSELLQQCHRAVPAELGDVIVCLPDVKKVVRPLASFFALKPTPMTEIGAAMVLVPPELQSWL